MVRRLTRTGLRVAGLASAALLAMPAAAFASGPRVVLAPAILGFVGHAFGSVFHAIAGVVLGGLNWTVSVAGKFIVNTLGGLIRLLIPSSWAKDGLAVMHWIVAVPDYAGTITTPGGHTVYGFAGINALRDLFMWIGAGLLPLTLVYATSRATFGFGGHVAAPVGRVVALAGVLVSYPWWWSQAAAVVNQLTHFVLALPPVTQGLYRLMQYAVGGVALGGWQLIDLALMGAIGVALLGLIFLKVVVVLLGALLYATGPLMIALVPTQGGLVIARAWASAALALVCLPLVWSSILAVGALLINDSSTAGPLIAGSGTISSLLGGLLLALAGLASLWLCLRAAREAAGIIRGQFAGVLAVGHARTSSTASTQPAAVQRASESLRSFATRLAGASGAALAAGGPAGRVLASSGATLATNTRGGLLGAGGSAIRAGARGVAPGTAALVGRSRAGAVAVRMARAGKASWQSATPSSGLRGAPATSNAPASASPRATSDRDGVKPSAVNRAAPTGSPSPSTGTDARPKVSGADVDRRGRVQPSRPAGQSVPPTDGRGARSERPQGRERTGANSNPILPKRSTPAARRTPRPKRPRKGR